MSTNDERAMILKMLQEGKISVEEADSLLDVLSDTDGDSAGFAAAAGSGRPHHGPTGQTGPADRADHQGAGGAHSQQRNGQSGATGESTGSYWTAGAEGPKLDFDIDLSGLSEGIQAAVASVKQSMSGVSESLRTAFADMGDFSFSVHEGRMGKARAEREMPLSLDAETLVSLLVRNSRGDVRVIGGEESGIHGVATVTAWGDDEQLAEEALSGVSVNLDHVEGRARLETETGGAASRVRVDLEITVPRALQLEISAVSGDLWVENVAAACSIQSVSGDISIANVGAEAECGQHVATQSGDIVVTSVSGAIELATASGSITVDEFHGELSATSKSGDIRVLSGDGPVQAQSVSGDVTVELNEADRGAVNIKTVGGDLQLVVPVDAALSLSARTLSGEISVSDEFDVSEKKRSSANATLNGGDVPCSLSSVSGDLLISVRR